MENASVLRVRLDTNTIDHRARGRREALEGLCRTRIMRVDEFCDAVAELAR